MLMKKRERIKNFTNASEMIKKYRTS